jgi:hypothetical protein
MLRARSVQNSSKSKTTYQASSAKSQSQRNGRAVICEINTFRIVQKYGQDAFRYVFPNKSIEILSGIDTTWFLASLLMHGELLSGKDIFSHQVGTRGVKTRND